MKAAGARDPQRVFSPDWIVFRARDSRMPGCWNGCITVALERERAHVAFTASRYPEWGDHRGECLKFRCLRGGITSCGGRNSHRAAGDRFQMVSLAPELCFDCGLPARCRGSHLRFQRRCKRHYLFHPIDCIAVYAGDFRVPLAGDGHVVNKIVEEFLPSTARQVIRIF